MKDLKRFILDKKQIKLPLTVMIYSVLVVISAMIGSKEMISILEPLNIPGSAIYIVSSISMLLTSLLALVILVNISYLVIKTCLRIFENKEIQDKKYLKQLLYMTSLFTGMISVTMSIIVSLVIGNSDVLTVISSINELFIGLISLYMQFAILKYYLNTEKIHKVLPLAIYLTTMILQIMNAIGV